MDADDKVLAFVRVTGVGRARGAEFDIRIAHLWTLRDGLVVRAARVTATAIGPWRPRDWDRAPAEQASAVIGRPRRARDTLRMRA